MNEEAVQEAPAEEPDFVDEDPIEGVEPSDEADDEDEIEFEGKVFRGPKAIKDVLAQREAVEAAKAEVEAAKERFTAEQREKEEAFAKQADLQRQFAADLAEVRAMDKLIAQWRAFEPRTHEEAEERRDALDRLKDEREQAGQALGARMTQAQHEAAMQAQQSDARSLAEFNDKLKKIPGWSEKLSQEVFAHATKTGFTQAELAALRDVRAVDTLRKAYLYDQQTAKQSAAKTVQAQQATAPAPQVGGKRAPPTGLDDRLSAEEWTRRRNEQIRKRNG